MYNLWKRQFHRILTLTIAAGVLLATLTGCQGYRLILGNTDAEFTNYEGISIPMERAVLLLAENKYSYEDMFNTDIWLESVDGVSMETYTKDLVKDTVEHMVFLCAMAEDLDISITEEEEELLDRAASEYMKGYEEAPENYSEATVRAYYRDLLLCEKVFYACTASVDTEVSTDEARIIDVQYLFFSKTEVDEDGNPVTLSSNAYEQKKETAKEILKRIRDGEDLISFAEEYSDDTSYYLELGRGEYNEDFENAAFELEMGDVSDLVETDVGCYIIKCTNDNVSDDYEHRKESIVMERRLELFEETYKAAIEDASLEYNDDFWRKYAIEDIAKGTGLLQSTYERYFAEKEE